MPRINRHIAEKAARRMEARAEPPDDWNITFQPPLTQAEFKEAVRKYMANPLFEPDPDEDVGIFD